MPRQPTETSVRALGHEARLQLWREETKGDVHTRATLRLGPAAVKTRGAVKRGVEQSGFLAVAGRSCSQATLRQEVLSNQAHNVNSKHRRGIQQRVVRCHLDITHGGW